MEVLIMVVGMLGCASLLGCWVHVHAVRRAATPPTNMGLYV